MIQTESCVAVDLFNGSSWTIHKPIVVTSMAGIQAALKPFPRIPRHLPGDDGMPHCAAEAGRMVMANLECSLAES